MKLTNKIIEYYKNPLSLQKRLLFIIVVAWIVPISILFIFISTSYRNNVIDRTKKLMEEELTNYLSLEVQKLEEAISISKEISYEQVIEQAWREYIDEAINETTFYKLVTSNLRDKYGNNNRYVMATVYLCDNPERLYYTTRKSKDYINNYRTQVQSIAMEITKKDTTDVYIKIIENEIFVIRNLYTTRKYQKFGTLVIQLDREYFFNGLTPHKDYRIGFFTDNMDSSIYLNSKIPIEDCSDILSKLKENIAKMSSNQMIKVENDSYLGYSYQQNLSSDSISAVLIADKEKMYSELVVLTKLIGIIIAVAIPICIFMLYFFSKHISKPIKTMIAASMDMGKGNMGIQLESTHMANQEFKVLADSFNQMSAELKYLFDYAYNEELARKEAKIIALQSQINPHFLNNTLEMMNWQARLAGDVEVSKMISALGTLLDYSMDRTNRKLISLFEELRCADAYFYIISMRFGQRLRVEKEVDERLLDFLVPQLILQPVLENAVMHGIDLVKSGRIQLKIYQEKEDVILEVTNTGKGMSTDEIEYVEHILNGTTGIKQGKGKHTSLGIRNVNERIKLIYGEQYGLTIQPVTGTDEVVSRIRIPFEGKKTTDDMEKFDHLTINAKELFKSNTKST